MSLFDRAGLVRLEIAGLVPYTRIPPLEVLNQRLDRAAGLKGGPRIPGVHHPCRLGAMQCGMRLTCDAVPIWLPRCQSVVIGVRESKPCDRWADEERVREDALAALQLTAFT